jgi:hypothetical protein
MRKYFRIRNGRRDVVHACTTAKKKIFSAKTSEKILYQAAQTRAISASGMEKYLQHVIVQYGQN